jgi:hypothetical protein
MEKWSDVAAAMFAFIAAVFWFLSAAGKLPPIVGYWDSTPETDPFRLAVVASAKMNRWAAGFSGASALSMATRIFAQRLTASG